MYALQCMCVKVPIVSQTSGLSLKSQYILTSGGWVDHIIDSHSFRCVCMHAGVCVCVYHVCLPQYTTTSKLC